MESDILDEVSGFKMLVEVTQWVGAKGTRAALAGVVTQDEFTHDIVVSVDGVFLVFDTN